MDLPAAEILKIAMNAGSFAVLVWILVYFIRVAVTAQAAQSERLNKQFAESVAEARKEYFADLKAQRDEHRQERRELTALVERNTQQIANLTKVVERLDQAVERNCVPAPKS